jgi:anti-sigma regulatory factor (Ser/Thr protein kinase)
MTRAGTSPRTISAATALPPRMAGKVLPARPDQVREARSLIAGLLEGSPITADATLCTSELVANAIVHSKSRDPGGQFTIRAEIRRDCLRVEVRDGGGPWNWPPPADDEHGRGLLLVSILTRAWGRTGSSGTGWTAWFEMPMTECP